MSKSPLMVLVALLLLVTSSAFSLPTTSASGCAIARDATLQLGSNSEILSYETDHFEQGFNQSRFYELNLGSGLTGNDWKSDGFVGWKIFYDPRNEGTSVPDEGRGRQNDICYVSTVPEPMTLILLAIGLAGLGLRKR
jgi:hypothetical protein